MKKLFLAAVFFAIASCSEKKEITEETAKSTDTVTLKQDSAKVVVSKNQQFLDKFKIIELDSTRFVSPDYDVKNVGPSLTKKEMELFPKSLNVDSFVGEQSDFQAYAKFEINPQLLGLVARMPGEYSFTALKLFFYDKTKDEILPQYFEVADKMGDAGYSEEIKSWLWKEGNQLKSLTYYWTKVEKIEPDDPTRESQTNDYYLIKLSPEKIDTARISKANLGKFQKLLNQK
ncbi:hypothetical protein MTP09_03405 [Chryseobacterium suipulveris]|uniref:Lipoprotein n=1 Tax=Chryseobacterium suipulveris TaxID=2929800 RepID=A0ABY4BVG3_9FLAO|nr:hypothetical protein [Chryseobacterium suipulveris]UOE41698.1 hypothetical protein MTP09_03405 [Chryseobacterium suipulveris]